MEIFLNNFYRNLVINTSNNLIAIYGENNSGKTKFLNNLILMIQNKKKMMFSEDNYENERDIIFVSEDWDLKKELTLNKTSHLKKFIFDNLSDILEKNNIDLENDFHQNENLKLITKSINQLINLESENYNLSASFKFENDLDLIESLFEINILDVEENKVNEKNLSKSEKLKLYLNLIMKFGTKKRIFLFDCPETFLDIFEMEKMSSLINNLAKSNLVFVTFRNPNLLKFLNINKNELFYLNNSEIFSFNINKRYLLNYYYFSNAKNNISNINSFFEFETLFTNFESVTEKEDYQKIEKDFITKSLVFILQNLNLSKFNFFGNLNVFLEEEKFKIVLFLIFNKITFSELKFDSWIAEYYEQTRE